METANRLRKKLVNRPRTAVPAPPSVRRYGNGIKYNPHTLLSRSVSQIKGPKLAQIWGPNENMYTNQNERLGNVTPVNNAKPNFIIKWGPPASGKGSDLVKRAISKLGHPLSSYIQFGVDDAVEATTYFQKVSANQAREYFKGMKSANNMIAKLDTITQSNANMFGKTYSNARVARNNENKRFGNKLDEAMTRAIEEGRNITFETTGGAQSAAGAPAWPSWIWRGKRDFFQKYNLIIVFPMRPFLQTWMSYRKRAVDMYTKTGLGFRFSSTKSRLSQEYFNSYRNFERNLTSAEKMGLVTKVVVVPHKGRALQWSPRRTLHNSGRSGLRSRTRQAIIDLCRKYYLEHLMNNNFN